MPLKLRPTGLGHGVYKNNIDYGVFCGEWCMGRTRTEICAGSGRSTPQVSQGTWRISNQVATLDEATAEFEARWKQWKEGAALGEAPNPPRSAG